MIRETCGSLAGLVAHQGAGERMCGVCAYWERALRLAAEGIPQRPTPPGALPTVSPAEAQLNAQLLSEEVEAHDRAAGNPTARRTLRVVRNRGAA